jgi:hypothetical protein
MGIGTVTFLGLQHENGTYKPKLKNKNPRLKNKNTRMYSKAQTEKTYCNMLH